MILEDGFGEQTTVLAAALDRGSPLRIRLRDGDTRTYLTRARKLLAKSFTISLGPAGHQTLDPALRIYEGRELRDTGFGGNISLAIAGASFTAVLAEPSGDTIGLRNLPESGEFQVLEMRAAENSVSCVIDHEEGIAYQFHGGEPLGEPEWRSAPEVEIEPVIFAAGGVNPATGRLDKYVEPIPLGTIYSASLKPMLAVLVLDKLATGENSTERLTRKTSEYLARMANVAAVHEHQLGVRLLIQELILTPDSAAYTDVPDGLGEFSSWMNLKRPRKTYRWNLATKFGDIGSGGGAIGLAYLSSLNSNHGVSVCKKGFAHVLVAHEMGHNMGSNHSNGGIMNSGYIANTRDFFRDVSGGETSAKDIYDHARKRLGGSHAMRHPEQIPFANDDRFTTSPNTEILLDPISNDDRSVRNGVKNTTLSIEEVGRVHPLEAGTVKIRSDRLLQFTPAKDYNGIAWFSYSLRGNVGNRGQGWLHKGDVSVRVGNWDPNSLNLELAPGQVFSFRPSGSSRPKIETQPIKARVDTSRDDRKLIIIRVFPDATGTDSFVFRRDGKNFTVNIVYRDDFLQTMPDVLVVDPQEGSIRIDPLANDRGGGYRNAADINPVRVGSTTDKPMGLNLLPGAFKLIAVENLTPSKGTVSTDTGRFTIDSAGETLLTGPLTFTPTPGANGVARIAYTVEDAAGLQQSNTVSIILPLARIVFPLEKRVMLPTGHGLRLAAESFPDPQAMAPLSAVVTTTWRIVRQPSGASAVFDDAAALETGVRFSAPGLYVIEITGSDNGFATHEQMTVVVEEDVSMTGPTNSLFAWWKLDESDGNIVEDSSSNGRNGVRKSRPIWGSGIIGGGLNFDGNNDYLDLSSHAEAMNTLRQGSIVASFRSGSSSEQILFSASDTSDHNRNLTIRINDGLLKYKVRGDIETDTASIRSPGIVNDGAWHLACVTVDLARNVSLYVDGEAVATGSRPFFDAVFDIDSVAIGRGQTSVGGDDYFRGDIDDVRIYDRVLTAEEVMEIARIPANRAPSIALNASNPQIPQTSFDLGLLGASVSDDGKPSDLLVHEWSQINGPASAVFHDPGSLSARVEFPEPGDYTFRLAADDGAAATFKEITITHTGVASDGPFSLGIPDIVVEQKAFAPNALEQIIELSPIFADPQDPASALTFSVTANSNPSLFSRISTISFPPQLRLEFVSGMRGSSELSVEAVDSAGNAVQSTFTISVINGPPRIESQRFSIAENSAGGTSVGVVLATDPNGDTVSFAISGGNDDEAFAIDPSSGELTVAASTRLDYESQAQFDLLVSATDGINRNLETVARVTVLVTDVDEPPQVPEQSFLVLESAPAGTELGFVSASDPEGRPLQFEIFSGNPGDAFSIDSDGLLRISKPGAIDSAITPSFQLSVLVSDGTNETESIIGISLETIVVPEFAAAKVLVPTGNADSEIWIENDYDDSHWMETTTGVGYDQKNDYNDLLNIDLQNSMFDINTTVYLRIAFEVSNPAAIAALRLRMKYDDGFVAYLNGTEVAAANAPATLSWDSEATQYNPDEDAIDFESFALIGAPSVLRAGENVLAIHGLNSNPDSSDLLILPQLRAALAPPVNGPPWIESQRFSIAENSAEGTSVGVVLATDPNGDTVSFAISGGNDGEAFAIDPSSGELTVAASTRLDHESQAHFDLLVSATDGINRNLETAARVTVLVTDVDEPPQVPEQSFLVLESAPAGTELGFVSASDPEGRPLQFEIFSGNPGDAFSIDSDGLLRISKPSAIDSAITPSFQLSVLVSDGTNETESIIGVSLEAIVVPEFAAAKVLVPTGNADSKTWIESDYDDSLWMETTTGVGYDQQNDYNDLLNIDLQNSMFDINTTAYLRIAFEVPNPAAIAALRLRMKYDDGFVAYLNGTEVAAANAPATLSWDSEATQANPDEDAIDFESFALIGAPSVLRAGENVLAIHGLNSNPDSSDLLILPELRAALAPPVVLLFKDWISSYPSLSEEQSGPSHDPDRDGATNFQEFAFGGKPTDPTDIGAQQPLFEVVGGTHQLALRLRKGASLNVVIEQSTDLQTASWSPALTSSDQAMESEDGLTETIIHVLPPPSDAKRKFYRVRIESPSPKFPPLLHGN